MRQNGKKSGDSGQEGEDTRPSDEQNERYYMRNYVKEKRMKMTKCISEQVMRNEFNFFREINEEEMLKEELEEGTDDDEDMYGREEENSGDIQDELREHLYGRGGSSS